MLGNNYIGIDGVGFTPSDFDYEINAVEEVNESEAGTDLINVSRLNKHVFHASWEGIDSVLLSQLISICELPTVRLSFENEVYLCRARGINPKLIKKSYKYTRSDGLWNVTVTFTQV